MSWDVDGCVRGVHNGDHVNGHGYDNRGRVTGKSLSGGGLPVMPTGSGGPYVYGYGYDQAGHKTSIVYPSQLGAETVTSTFDSDGRPYATSGSQSYVAGSGYWPNGQLGLKHLGTSGTDSSGVSRWYQYDDLNRLSLLLGRRNTNTG